ncbi:MAG: hypothetical protein Q8R82_19525 [Hyphomonadaceae bacterium]|nr:hypothetical protein [Hyphomonadaceae bacterium]
MTSIWTPHLHPGERIIWSASISSKLVSADLARQRLMAIFIFLPSTIVAALLTLVFLGSIAPRPTINPDAMLAPIYLAFALAIAVLAVAQLFKLARPRQPETAHYAATDQRLIALDAAGVITAEMPAAEIGDVMAGGSRPDLAVLRRDEDSEAAAFPIRFIDRPLEAKAIIEENFPAPPPAES